MRAVNLIPADARPGGGNGGAGRSGGAVYVLLGGLVVLVALVGLWAKAGSSLSSDRAELDRLHAEASTAQAQTTDLSSFASYHALRQTRTETVKTLAESRVDWAADMDAVARTMPAGAWLSSMTAAASAATAPAGGTGGSGAVASTSMGPSLQIGGCIGSQARVARLMPRLRAIPHVNRVSLVSSTAADSSGPAGSSSSACKTVSFEMVVFFDSTAPVPAAAPAGTAPVPAETGAPAQ